MNALRDLQSRCYDAFVMDDAQALGDALAGSGVIASVGHLVYRNNVIESTLKTLAACYPVILRLVGRDCLRSLGRDYRIDYPSTSGNLDAFGEGFPQFLAGLYARSPYGYLADVARLEWAISRLADRPAAAGAPLDCLQGLDAQRFARLRWQLHPGIATVQSTYPIYRIWSLNTAGDDGTIVDLDDGGESVFVSAAGRHPHVEPITSACAAFIDALGAGAALGEACDAVLAADPDFDLAAALQLLVRTGAVATITGSNCIPAPYYTPPTNFGE